MEPTDSLIRTKLRVPRTRPALVPRPRLQEHILAGLRGPLTLVTAPAGFGKTTLVASSMAASNMAVGWLALDRHDNQAGRFLTYLIAALHEANAALGLEARELMAAQPVPPEAVLTSLINDLDRAGQDVALVLDDYQFINNQAVHGAVGFMLEFCPHVLHMVIATRADPPLPVARMRARGQVVELRAAELRFTRTEAAQFLNEMMGLHLDVEAVEALEERTEGWIAGLQMAALSMRDRDDKAGFIRGFSGTNRYILDYLLEEVLASQPPEIEEFLVGTSVLERLTAPLCDMVLGALPGRAGPGQEQPARNSSAILEYLERANLFVVALDDERIWYRYHHLFTDLLRARLDQLWPGIAPQLHAKAVVWLEGEGMAVEAVNHAIAAGHYECAARLVEEYTTRLLAQGELNALMGWIETLPAEVRLSRPWLCLHQASAMMFAGRAAEVAPLLAQAEAGLPAETDSAQDSAMDPAPIRALRGAIAATRAYTAVLLGQDVEVLRQGELARELLPPTDLGNRAVVFWATGRTLQTQGRLAEALLAFEEQVRLARIMGHIWALMAGLTALAWAVQAQGRLPQARALLEEGLSEASRAGARGRGFIAWVGGNLAGVLYEQNQLDAASALLDEALDLVRQWPNPNHEVYAHTIRARVCVAQGNLESARRAIGEADRIRTTAPLSRWLRRTAEAGLVRVWLALRATGVKPAPGDTLAETVSGLVAAWRSELAAHPEDDVAPMDECAQIAALALARVALAAERFDEALGWLEAVGRRTRAAGYVGAPVESLLLAAIARQGQTSRTGQGLSRESTALAALDEALRLAEPGGYTRVFLDAGGSLQMLLAQWVAQADAGALRDYALRLLSQFDQRPASMAAPTDSREGELVEPLSPREKEVLQLLALGKTNVEIARQLIVAPGTVKAHTASIYRKLDSANRTEAVSRARRFGIVV